MRCLLRVNWDLFFVFDWFLVRHLAWYVFTATQSTQYLKCIWLGLVPTVDTYPNINVLCSIH